MAIINESEILCGDVLCVLLHDTYGPRGYTKHDGGRKRTLQKKSNKLRGL
jgi:hypothetical protein